MSIDDKFAEKKERRMSGAGLDQEPPMPAHVTAARMERRGSMDMKFAARKEIQSQQPAAAEKQKTSSSSVLGSLQSRIEGIFKNSKTTAKPTFKTTAQTVTALNANAIVGGGSSRVYRLSRRYSHSPAPYNVTMCNNPGGFQKS